jgi:hypothetical protein
MPTAPVTLRDVVELDGICPGSGTQFYDADAADTRRNFGAGNGARCKSCGSWETVTQRGWGNLRKHKRPTE